MSTSSINFGGGAVAADNTNANTGNTTSTDNSNASENTSTNNSGNINSQNNTPPPTDNSISNNNTSSNATTQPVTTTDNGNNSQNVKSTPTTNTTAAAKSNVVYHVQLGAFTNKPSKTKFAEYGAVKVIEDGGLFKVLAGTFKTMEEARTYKKALLAKGVEGVFIVAYENGVRVKL